MKLVSSLLCEAANTMPDGRFNILGGGINDVHVIQFPVNIKLCIILRFELFLTTEGKHDVEVNMIDGDGRQVIKPFNMTFNVNPKKRFANFVIDIGQLKIPEAGMYSFEVSFDKKHLQSLPLEAKQHEKHQGNK